MASWQNLNNKEESEKRFKEINEAYQILSVSETKVFHDDRGVKKGGKNKEERLKESIEKAISTITVKFESHPEITEKDLDSGLWIPYSNWHDKVKSLRDSRLTFFQEKLILAIQKKSEEKEIELLNQEIKRETKEKIKTKSEGSSLEREILEEINWRYEKEVNELNNDKDFSWKIKEVESRMEEYIEKLLESRKSLSEDNKEVNEESALKDEEFSELEKETSITEESQDSRESLDSNYSRENREKKKES